MTKRIVVLFVVTALFCSIAVAQEKGKPRVFVTDSDSWQMSGGFAANSNGGGGAIQGGARPQTAEIIKTFNERCENCIVTMKQDKADYIVVLEHEGGKGYLRKDNKFALFNREGDAIASGSTRSLGNSVKDACTTLMKDWEANGARSADSAAPSGEASKP